VLTEDDKKVIEKINSDFLLFTDKEANINATAMFGNLMESLSGLEKFKHKEAIMMNHITLNEKIGDLLKQELKNMRN